MSSRFIIISAVNEYYLPLLSELLQSLFDCKTTAFSFDIGVLDVGLSERNRQKMESYGVIVRAPGVDVDYPGREDWEKKAPYYRAMTARPSLPNYFPGYDAYMWMDADTWVQMPEALEVMLQSAAKSQVFYATSEDDLAYRSTLNDASRFAMYRNCFDDELSTMLQYRPMVSAGFFALSGGAPHWQRWHQVLSEQLNAIKEVTQRNFMMEQLSLNLALCRDQLDVQFMPPEYHWIVTAGMPAFDETAQLFVLPKPPHRPISVLHLAAEIKNTAQTFQTLGGHTLNRPLTYSSLCKARLNPVS